MSRSRRIGWAALIALIVMLIAAWLPVQRISEVLLERERVVAWLGGLGAWAPLVFIAITCVSVIIAPMPGQVIGVAGGYLFGMWAGLLYATIGTLLGSGAAMWIGRRFGRPVVTRLAGDAALARFDRFSHQRGALFFALVFLVPFLPDDVACYAVGLSSLPILPMLILSMVLRLPAGAASVLIGDNMTNLPPGVMVAGVIGLLVIGALVWRYQKPLEGALMRWITRVSGSGQRIGNG